MKRSEMGIDALDVMIVVFILLKLTGSVSWSWPMVLAPFWVGVILACIYWLAVKLIKDHYEGKRFH